MKNTFRARELIEEDGQVSTLAIMRDALQDMLLSAVPKGVCVSYSIRWELSVSLAHLSLPHTHI
jgi:hypothetical protein